MSIEILSFLIAAVLVAVTPGPGLIYVAAFSLRFGVVAGLVSASGVNAGSYVLILIAGLGLYPILQTVPQLVEVIQSLGGLYLIYLATRMWPRKADSELAVPDDPEVNYKRVFARGIVTTLLNPKDVLFYILFIPTFIPESTGGDLFLYVFFLMSIAYALIGLLTKCAIALFAGRLRNQFASTKAPLVNYVSATMLGGLGVFVLGKAYYRMTE